MSTRRNLSAIYRSAAQSFRRRMLDRFVLRPTRNKIPVEDQQRVMLSGNGHRLECFVHFGGPADAPPDLLVLKFPGTAGRAERSSPFPAGMIPNHSAAGRRTDVWTWNPPGYGRSGGRATLGQIAEASVAFWELVMKWYKCQPSQRSRIDEPRVWLCGNSLGGVTALHAAAAIQPEPQKAGLILRNPPPLVPVVKRIASQYPMSRWVDNVAESLDDAMNAEVTAANASIPAVFLQSEQDTLVPPSLQERIINAYNGPKRVAVLEGLEHDELPDEAHVVQIRHALAWLWDQGEPSQQVAG